MKRQIRRGLPGLACAGALAWLSVMAPRAGAGPVRFAADPAQATKISAADPRVQLDTSKGAIVIQVHHDWAPIGADRFLELVKARYYDDTRFFRVVKGQWAQFGINGDPKVSVYWRDRPVSDDPRGQSVTRGRVAFAFAVPNGRTSQVYISLRDNSYQDDQGFVPFGEVVAGMDVADALNSEYGESSGGGIRAGKQQPLFENGNAFLDREYPRLDRILRATVWP